MQTEIVLVRSKRGEAGSMLKLFHLSVQSS